MGKAYVDYEKVKGNNMQKTIIGTGIFNLDTIVVREYPEWPAMRPFVEKEVLQEVGGTCGNVMCMLSWMGWDARPIASLDDSEEGRKITKDLKHYDCDCRYVTNTPEGGTTMLRCTHKKTVDGKRSMSVRAGSPGGSRFPKRHFLRARDEAPVFMDQLIEVPSVFFFDDPAAGHRYLAREMKRKGCQLVYFEPSKVATNADFESIRVSDVIKFSDENVPDVSFTELFPDKVFIQTMGPKGVRYKYKGRPWEVVEALPVREVVDTEGAGDCFTATFINAVAESGLTLSNIPAAIREAMENASRSVGYFGSKGFIREGSKRNCRDCAQDNS